MGINFDIDEPLRLSRMDFRETGRDPEMPQEFFERIIIKSFGAVLHYFETFKNELVYDLKRYVENVEAFVTLYNKSSFFLENPVRLFQEAAWIAAPGSVRMPSGHILIDTSKKSLSMTPIFMQVNETSDSISDRLERVQIFSKLTEKQKESVVNFLETWKLDLKPIQQVFHQMAKIV